LCTAPFAFSRQIKPGFDGNEFRKMFQISAHQIDTPWTRVKFPFPVGYSMVCRSAICGLDNRWDMWLSSDSVAVISIRGTTGTTESWMENFYAGMIPATGTLNMGNDSLFHYKLAADSTAYVHIGWTIGLASMAPDIVKQVNVQYNNGIRDFIIMGHSQGGAIAFLLYSYLHYQRGVTIPADIRIKVYGSAAPKVGNLKFAYDFDFIARDGWAFRIVNAADWVPEVPFTIQTLSDLNRGNPFTDFDRVRGLSWPAKFIAKRVMRSMNRKAKKAEKRFRKYLAVKTGRFVRRKIPGMPKQKYVHSMAYFTCGTPIILQPDQHYHTLYPDKGGIFTHHYFGPYYYLFNIYYPVK
ncbi:MAG TPA: lipase family protein, partial [Bacteroidia bacterium]|nr:lipase family protein [Bacteroidia bacterium]